MSHQTLSTDSEATAEGAVRAAGGPAGDEEQDILQVTVKLCHVCDVIVFEVFYIRNFDWFCQ